MSKPLHTWLSFIFGVAFVVLCVVIALLKPQPSTFQYNIFRTVLALAGAGIAAVIPGFIEVKFGTWLRATGAIALFVVLYFFSPAKLIDAEQSASSASAAQSKTFSGRVFDATTKKSIAGAEIFVAQDQLAPEMVFSDSNGAFVVLIHPTTSIMRLDVSAKNYVPQVRTVSPMRSGLEEFDLQHTNPSPSQHVQKPTTTLPPTTQSAPTGGPNTPSQNGSCQNTVGPCVGLNNGTANMVTLDTPPPPVRNVDPNNVADAIATLKIAPEHTKVRIDGIGASVEMESFVSQLIGMFQLGGWNAFKGIHSSSADNIIITSAGTSMTHGEGIRCASSNKSADDIARRALSQIGYFCKSNYSPDSQNRFPADVFLSVGAPSE